MSVELRRPRIVVGLGNPGPEYEATRHNIGFRVVDRIAERFDVRIKTLEHRSLVGRFRVGPATLILAKPQTFMNASGESVKALVRRHDIPAAQVCVVFDDIDLPLGDVRLRPFGGAGGHRGMTSIIECLKSEGFPRVRVGIRGPVYRGDLVDYVLQPFRKDERAMAEDAVDRAADAVLFAMEEGWDAAMNRYNRREEAPGDGDKGADGEPPRRRGRAPAPADSLPPADAGGSTSAPREGRRIRKEDR